MSVDSYLEFFILLFGWVFYGILWDVLVSIGIVYLLFLGILIDNWCELAQGGEVGYVSGLLLWRMEIELFIVLLVVVFVGQFVVLILFNVVILFYLLLSILLNLIFVIVMVVVFQSIYGVMGFIGFVVIVNVFVWWYGVIVFSFGLNYVIVEGLLMVVDMCIFEQQVYLVIIVDLCFWQVVSDFFSQCYVLACFKYQVVWFDILAINVIFVIYGFDDLDWMGFYVYWDIVGFYDILCFVN